MITFKVVKEEHGWAVRMGDRMTTPFWSRDLAIREANVLADAIRRHGQRTEVIIEDAEPSPPFEPTRDPGPPRRRGRSAGRSTNTA